MKKCTNKNCKRSGQILPFVDFYKRPDQPGKYKSHCKECIRDSSKKWHQEHKDFHNAANKEWYRENREKVTEWWKKNREKSKIYNLKKFGLTLSEYNAILLKQNNCCAICNINILEVKRKFCVDHDHSSGIVRGLLCHSCNIAIGLLGDDANILENAKNYILKNKYIDLESCKIVPFKNK